MTDDELPTLRMNFPYIFEHHIYLKQFFRQFWADLLYRKGRADLQAGPAGFSQAGTDRYHPFYRHQEGVIFCPQVFYFVLFCFHRLGSSIWIVLLPRKSPHLQAVAPARIEGGYERKQLRKPGAPVAVYRFMVYEIA